MCKICKDELENNVCKKCSILYYNNKTVCQRHNWHIKEYMQILEKVKVKESN